jgi:hypothetical protein
MQEQRRARFERMAAHVGPTSADGACEVIEELRPG